ncbi:hypothetical protein ACHAWF_000473 [Thalassiosira exigua]
MIITVDDILHYVLCYVGFGDKWQKVVRVTNVDRFKAHFGPEPRTVKDLNSKLLEKFPDTE